MTNDTKQLEEDKKLLEDEDQLDLYLALVASAPLEHFQEACERFKDEYLKPLLSAKERVVRADCTSSESSFKEGMLGLIQVNRDGLKQVEKVLNKFNNNPQND
jgi:hypothetical protein